MGFEKAVMGIVPGLQATALMGQNLKMARMGLNPRTSQKKMTRTMLRTSVGTIAGIGLMKPTASMINDL